MNNFIFNYNKTRRGIISRDIIPFVCCLTILFGIILTFWRSKQCADDNSVVIDPAFSSIEECLEYIDTNYSFDWEEEWKRYGLCFYYFESDELSQEDMKLVLENGGDALSLFPLYFDTNYVSEEEKNTVIKIAGLITQYIINNYGIETFIVCKASDFINEWLKTIGSGLTYTDPFAQNLQDYQFEEHLYYSLVAISERGEYLYLQPVANYLDSAYKVRRFLSEYIEGTGIILAYIQKEAPVSYQILTSRRPPKVEIYFDETVRSYATRTQIHLRTTVEVFHELIHVWFYSKTIDSWLREGIAVLIPDLCYQMPSYAEETFAGIKNIVNILAEGLDATTIVPGSEIELTVDAICLYTFLYGVPETSEEVDFLLLTSCYAKVQSLYMKEGGHGIPYDLVGGEVPSIIRNEDELTYTQAAMMVYCIIQQDGLDVFLQALLKDDPNDNIYKQSYQDIKESFEEQFIDYEEIQKGIQYTKSGKLQE